MKEQIKQIIKDSQIYELAKEYDNEYCNYEDQTGLEKDLDLLVTIIINTFERARLNEIPEYKTNVIFNKYKDRGDY